MKHLIIGYGQIGEALEKVLCEKYTIHIIDRDHTTSELDKHYEAIHICFSYYNHFIEHVKRYIKEFSSDVVIIHSTVPIGTTRKIGKIAVHSPIRGVHPNLEDGIRTFVKYFGGEDLDKANLAADIFERFGINTLLAMPEDTEAGKLLSTTYYGWNIIFQKAVKKFCDDNKLDYAVVYEHFNKTYNEGYNHLDMDNVVRPVLEDMQGQIGGHCIIPNAEMLKENFMPAKLIVNTNKEQL